MDSIAGWSQAELRRFIVNTILSDPGAMPPSPLPAGSIDGDVPVWDAASKLWRASTTKPVEGRMLQLHDGATPPRQPVQGDLWRYPSGSGSWLFDYQPRQDTSYPWQFIGGGPMAASNDNTTQQTSGGFNFADDGADPSLLLPFTGFYQVRYQVEQYMNSAATSFSTIGSGVAINGSTGTPSLRSHDLKAFQNGRNGFSHQGGLTWMSLNANDTIKIIHYTDNFGPQIYARHIEATPHRITA